MSWIKSLYDTYENNKSIIGKEENGSILLPIFHITSKSHLTVSLNEKGEFLDAIPVEDDENIIIPCTEESSVRAGSKAASHVLNDKIQYLAKDYDKYGDKYHGYSDYMEKLGAWYYYNPSNKKIKAVYQYVEKGTLIDDLIKASIFEIFEGGLVWGPQAKGKIKVDPRDFYIRWQVESRNMLEEYRTWKDLELYDQWIEYYLSTRTEEGFCYVLGKHAPLESKHPKSIYNMCANAKIISSNDTSDFTFRGRFNVAQEAYGLSYEVSQKAHNALKWLIAKQGYNRGKKTVICWVNSSMDLPDPLADNFGLDVFEEEQITAGATADDIAHKLKLELSGYRKKFEEETLVHLMELESVTDGRLSITYYQEIRISDYISRLEKWYETSAWMQRYRPYGNKEGPSEFIGVPSPYNIAQVAYGLNKSVDETLKQKTISRLLTCIVEGTKIPQDLVELAFRKTVNRPAFEDKWSYEKSLSITCSLIKKYYYDYEREVYIMALDRERNSRDYLYGRLLAVAQNIEQWALQKTGEERLTNADRLMARFSTHPFSTWQIIELSIKPYLSKIGGGGAASREKLLDEIMGLFNPEDYTAEKPLTGEFLLGYHCQREDFRSKSKEQDNEKAENKEEV
ncbi:type I-C CRISPR-associated protein Cas8c/Csd1 [Proteiniclasticum ruminis]|uniref:CRISPR-associated protein Csd1 n=1 Tax=Proteiniclasticum ruminis TaxID=398199 RepID=A0A1G8T8P1_9CLOT|nr:type I-C CRISPR-associated protein Cas8c/Csd1 [Proteiniclasticum ruminis]SDJ37811.1 CRISPR-associated protein Csd1 [Proteiniclasticum ruminis]